MIDIVAKRIWFLGFSLIIFIVGLISLAIPPNLNLGILGGVTRSKVLDIGKKLNYTIGSKDRVLPIRQNGFMVGGPVYKLKELPSIILCA